MTAVSKEGFVCEEQRRSAFEALKNPYRMPCGLGARPEAGDFARAKVGVDYSRRSYTDIQGVPHGVDLTIGKRGGYFPPIFNQGERNTCVANASVAFLEYYWRVVAGFCPPLSRQYFHYKLKVADGEENMLRTFNDNPFGNKEFCEYYREHCDSALGEKENRLKCMEEWRRLHYSGARLGHAFDLLKHSGICPEEKLPYVFSQRSDTEAQLLDVNNPECAEEDMRWLYEKARHYRINQDEDFKDLKMVMVPGNSIDAYRRILSGNGGESKPMPLVFAVTLFQSYKSEFLNRTGWFSCPLSQDDMPVGGHAMLAVGYQDIDCVPGGGYIIARNSWGTQFAWDYRDHIGHARIPYAYIDHYAFSNAFSVRCKAEGDDGDADLKDYLKIAGNDMCDSIGRMVIRRGDSIILDRDGLAEKDTPENRVRFKGNNYRWRRA